MTYRPSVRRRDFKSIAASQDAALRQITDVVRAQLSVPSCAITLLLPQHQWFRWTSGYEVGTAPRENSFCHAAAEMGGLLAVSDARQDDRFKDHPMVWPENGVRSYIGMPIKTPNGEMAATLGVIDTKVRAWSDQERDCLTGLAKVAETLLAQSVLSQAQSQINAQVTELSERLTVQRQFLERVSEVADVGGWLLDLKTEELIWTSQTRRIHEVPDDFEPELATAIDFYEPEARNVIEAAIEKALQDGDGWDVELPLRTFKDNRIWVRAMGEVEYENGEPVRLVGAFHHITEQKRTENRLLGLNSALARAYSNLEAYQIALDQHAIVAITDKRGKITHANENFVRISGYSRDELIGQSHALINSGHHSSAFFKGMWAKIASGQHWNGEICNRAKDGKEYWVDTTIVPLKDAKGRIEQYVAIRFDITDRISKQRNLEREREEALEVADNQSRFLANMSHEIRTPLNGIVGLIGVLERTNLDEHQRKTIKVIEQSGNDLRAILSDVLDISKIESGQIKYEIAPIDLSKSIQSASELFRAAAEDKGLGFIVNIDPRLNGSFLCDGLRLRQIVSNLVSNAVKFTEVGSIEIKAYPSRAPSGEEAFIVEVIDSGCGLTAEEKVRVFNRYEQANTGRTRAFGGTGLGLSISRALTEGMDGELEVSSVKGKGSVFSVILPLVSAQVKKAELSTGPIGSDAFQRPKILLAEDHETNRRVFGAILEAIDCELVFAEDGEQAIQAFMDHAFDIVFMDIQMPHVDGITAIREIRKIEQKTGSTRTPIGAISAHVMKHHVDATLLAGADRHYSKPIRPDEFLAAAQELLSLRETADSRKSA